MTESHRVSFVSSKIPYTKEIKQGLKGKFRTILLEFKEKKNNGGGGGGRQTAALSREPEAGGGGRTRASHAFQVRGQAVKQAQQ